MRNFLKPLASISLAVGLAITVSACASIAPPSAVEVTRFHDASALSASAESSAPRTVFIADAPGSGTDLAGGLELATFKRAVAVELEALGYIESARADAAYIAQVSLDRSRSGNAREERNPVSVGVGGSTGSYGSGVGLGIGINLGGNKSTERIGTELAVMLRSIVTNQTVWEGRANWDVSIDSQLVSPAANAPRIAGALFTEFPGGNGETIQIKGAE